VPISQPRHTPEHTKKGSVLSKLVIVTCRSIYSVFMQLEWWWFQHLSTYIVAFRHLTGVGMIVRFVRFSLKVVVQNDRVLCILLHCVLNSIVCNLLCIYSIYVFHKVFPTTPYVSRFLYVLHCICTSPQALHVFCFTLCIAFYHTFK
jgi:hypothetical protein